ncbi:Ku protein [Streptomyces sp. NPDC047022]|uniref:Ku protein n=1 Tax=Streptomyces sp. NPDC047022 TaxID=3155737 RepID=UPI0033C093D1
MTSRSSTFIASQVEDREVPAYEIGKGYEVSRDEVVPVTDQELRSLPLSTAKAIEIEGFVPLSSVDPLRIGEGCSRTARWRRSRTSCFSGRSGGRRA